MSVIESIAPRAAVWNEDDACESTALTAIGDALVALRAGVAAFEVEAATTPPDSSRRAAFRAFEASYAAWKATYSLAAPTMGDPVDSAEALAEVCTDLLGALTRAPALAAAAHALSVAATPRRRPGDAAEVCIAPAAAPDRASAPARPTARSGRLAPLAALGLKLIKSAKVVKIALAAASLAGYAWMSSLPFALILMAALILHEGGHILAMKRCGMRTKGIYLIPFIGGAAVTDDAFPDRLRHMLCAAAGPLAGLLSILPVFLAVDLTLGWAAAWGAASFVALFNLFNLIPVRPLDGGRILHAVTLSVGRSTGLWLMGLCLAGGGVVMVGARAWGLLPVFAIGLLELFFEKNTATPERAMGVGGMALGIGTWLALVAAFVGLILVAGHIPGAEAALAALRE